MTDYLLLIPVFVLAAIITTLFIAASFTGKNGKTCLILKTLSSIGFILAAVCCLTARIGMQGKEFDIAGAVFILTGLVAGLAGDVVLAMRGIKSKGSDLFIFLGIACFLIGHILYILFLYRLTPIHIYEFIASAVVSAAIIAGGKFIFGNSYRKLLIPSIVYSFTLALMMCLTVKNLILGGVTPLALVWVIGSIMFAVSDAVLCHMFFGREPKKFMVVINLTTYYIAQNLIAVSLIFLM